MRKIKIFRFSEFNNAEATVNDWLAQHRTVIVHNVLQSESHATWHSWTLTITIFYYEGEQS